MIMCLFQYNYVLNDHEIHHKDFMTLIYTASVLLPAYFCPEIAFSHILNFHISFSFFPLSPLLSSLINCFCHSFLSSAFYPKVHYFTSKFHTMFASSLELDRAYPAIRSRRTFSSGMLPREHLAVCSPVILQWWVIDFFLSFWSLWHLHKGPWVLIQYLDLWQLDGLCRFCLFVDQWTN